MGVKELWSVVAPVGHHMPLKHLSGQTLAVDLSIWVCETQSVKRMQGVVTKPHLRNLFFRISHLSQLGVKLVFAIEGTAPDLKLETMSKRQNSQFPTRHSRAPKAAGRGKKPARSHFNGVLRECCEMLDCLGIPYVQSSGEAEAMCAVLNSHGLVDGCLTNDGDVFLYGARVVYRNFTMNTKDPHVEVFRMDDLERELGLNREKLVAMAILCGCDYMPQGVPGVGRELAGKLLRALDGEDVLRRNCSDYKERDVLFRMAGWRHDPALGEMEAHAGRKKVAHCISCHHPGSQRHHDKQGCTYCKSARSCTQNVGISCPCEWHEKQHQVELRAVEFSIRQKAIKLPNFPPKNVIQEFMHTKDKVTALRLTWRRPNLFHFQRLSCLKLEWEGEYALAKVLPLLTLHDMTALLEHGLTSSIHPHAVTKARVRHGVSCYEVEWNKLAGDTTTETEFYVTVESQDLFARCFPLIVQQFEQDTATKRKGTAKGKSKKKTAETEKQTTDADTAIADVTSELGRLQLCTERGDACSVFTGPSAAGPCVQGTDGEQQLSDDSCILLDSPGDVSGREMSPTHTRLDRVPECDSYLPRSPVTETNDTDEINSSEDVQSGNAEEHSDSVDDDDDDVDVFLSLSERLRRQKLAGLKGEAGMKPLTTSCTQDNTGVSPTMTALSSRAPVEQISKTLAYRENDDTSRLLQAEDKLRTASKHPKCSPQEVSAGSHHEKNGDCFGLKLRDEDTQTEGMVQYPRKKSGPRVVDSLETKASGTPNNPHVQQVSQMDDGNSNSCTDDELDNSSDLEECNVQQLATSTRSHGDTSTSCSKEADCSQRASLYSPSHSIEKSRSCWARDVIMSPNLFDSSYDDDDSICMSTLSPSVGTMRNQCDTDQSLCAISRWDIETPMHSIQPGRDNSKTGHNDGGNVQSDIGQLGCSFEDSSFSWSNPVDHDCSPALKPTHLARVNRTALDDSAFASFDSNAAYSDNISSHTHSCSQSLGDSACGDIGDFRLHSSLLSESLYLNDSTDLDDSVFTCPLEPSASDSMTKSHSQGVSTGGNLSLDPNPPCQKHRCKSNGTPSETVRGHSDNVPIKSDIQATHDMSTVNGAISSQLLPSPVCLADRLKLRLAKTNRAHLVTCLSRNTSTGRSSFNDC